MKFMGGADRPAFVEIVEGALSLGAKEMATAKDLTHDYGEDQLTDKLCFGLKLLGLPVTRERSTNGHCDLTVEGPFELRWIGEAKIYTSYVDLYGGFKQLCDRYATGIPGQDRGGVVIYFKGGDVVNVMKTWIDYVVENHQGMAFTNDPDEPLVYVTTHSHQATGLPYTVRHQPVTLMHNPTDTAAAPKRNRAQKAA